MNEPTMYDRTPGSWTASVNAADEMCVYLDAVSLLENNRG